jgi:hypothetical protein
MSNDKSNYLRLRTLDIVVEIAGTEFSVIMTQHGSSPVSHAVTVALVPSQMSPLIFRDPAIMLAVALANDWL